MIIKDIFSMDTTFTSLIKRGDDHIADLGETLLITGQSGSGKSRLGLALAKGFIKGGAFLGFDFPLPLSRDKKILLVDTEMSLKGFARRVQLCLGSLTEEEKGMVVPLSLLHQTPKERLKSLGAVMELYSPEVVVLDHTLGFLNDMNSAEEAESVLRELKSMFGQSLFVGIAHQSDNGGTKAKGHSGSVLTVDATAIINIQKGVNNGLFFVTGLKVREGEGFSCTLSFNKETSSFDLYEKKEKAATLDESIFPILNANFDSWLMSNNNCSLRSAQILKKGYVTSGLIRKDLRDKKKWLYNN